MRGGGRQSLVSGYSLNCILPKSLTVIALAYQWQDKDYDIDKNN